MSWKEVKGSILITIIFVIVVFLIVNFIPNIDSNNSCKEECVIIEKTESVKLMWELIQVQDNIIQILSEQNKKYDKFLGLVQGLETNNKKNKSGKN